MRSIEIIIDAEEKQDEHDLMAMFITRQVFVMVYIHGEKQHLN